MRRDALLFAQRDHQLIQRQVALILDPARDPTRNTRQLAMTATIALRLWVKPPRRTLQKHHVVHKLDRNPEPRRRSAVRVAFLNKINDTLTKRHRKCPAHQ